ncbi:MAG: hydroxymethylpyrimidine/phosphomethylpyrimidine kinase [Candidatus Thioglobus sp.]|nr:hydroxymethylpyrimidine/phosphomethylpyrimidine kinase [Candidatus Thioglobus sp.]
MENVLIFAGLDPSGGAGLAADVETINQFGLTPLPIITNLTVQNTASVRRLQEVSSNLITEQYQHLQADINFEVVKIGLLSSDEQIQTISKLISGKILVLDPIVKSSSGKDFLDQNLLLSLKKYLLPLAKIITPNFAELCALANLSGENNEQKAVAKLGCEWILVTKTDTSDKQIEHNLYHQNRLLESFNYAKLAGDFHGSGCTLASAIAAQIALGAAVNTACKRALDYTYQTLLNAKSVGKMQYHPHRKLPL